MVGLFFRTAFLFFLAFGCALADDTDSTPRAPDPLTRAVEQFKILTRDQGMRADSPPSASQHHGPKMLWHGRLYENFRNDILDAIPHEIKQNGQQNAVLHRNQFGFNVAGPLVIPHLLKNNNTTFFSLSYEGVRESISRASLHTIPTLPERTGNFAQTVDQAGNVIPVYDPTTTQPNPSYNPNLPLSTTNLQYLRAPFPGNVVPQDRLTPLVLKQLSLYPAPNTDIGPFFQNNFFVNSPQTDLADGVIANLDRSFGDKHRLTWASTYSNGFLGSAQYFPNIANPAPPDQNFSTRRGELDYIYTASPQTINTVALYAASTTFRAGTGGSQSPFPLYTFDNYLSMGAAYPDSHNAHNHYQFRDSLSTRKGKHSLGVSAQFDERQVNTFWPAYPSGYFQFSSGITSLPGIFDTGYSFASFLLGLPQYAEMSVIPQPSYFRESSESLSVSDKYEWTKNFTLSLGLSANRMTPRTEKYNRQSAIDPSVTDPSTGLPGALVFAGVNGISAGLRPVDYSLDPSAAIAWNPLGKSTTVVRASYSRYHSQIPLRNRPFSTQGFTARQTFTSPNTQLQPALDLATGVPPLPFTLPSLNPSVANNTTAEFLDLTSRQPLFQTASLSVERELPLSMVLSTGLSYSGGRDLLIGGGATNPNAISPNFLSFGNQLYDQAFRQSLEPFPQYLGFFALGGLYPAGRYQRDSAFVRVEKRASFGLSFVFLYSYSKQLDDYSAPYGEQDFFNSRNNWSPTAYNPPQYVQLSYVFEFPFGSNKPLFNYSDWRKPFIDGWSLTGTAYWNGGTPLALHPEYNFTGDLLSTLNVNTVPGVDPHAANQGPAQWFNPAAFAQPPDFTIGNASPTSPNLLNPGVEDLDVSLNKRLPFGAERALEISASAFNCLNHGNWNFPDTAIGPASAPNIDAGHIIGSHGGRVIQLGMKFSF